MKDNLFYLLEDDGRSLKVQNGVVSAVSQPTPIPNAPMDWRNFIISWERIMAKYGIQRNFGTQMGFVKDAAQIVRKAVYGQSYERKINFLIQQLTTEVTDTLYRQIYKYLYKGELDLSTASDEEVVIKCNIMEGGISKLLKANEATTYEIPFDIDAINVRMDGINITGIYKWTIVEQTVGASGALPTMVLIGEEQKAPGISATDVNGGYTFSFASADVDSTEYFLTSNILPSGGVGRFTGTINLSDPDTSFPAGIRVWVYNTISGTLTQIPLFVGNEASVITIDKEVPVNPGDRFFLQIDEYHFESNLTFTIQSKLAETTVKAYKPFDLFKKLVEKITGSPLNAGGQVLLDEFNLVITCGDAIRGIEGAKIKMSLNQFFEHAAVAHFGGMGIEDGKVVIEERDHFFDASDPVHLGNAKDLKVTLATDIMGNTFKIGWQDPEIEDVNGKYAINGSHLYTSPITRIVKEIPMVSPLSADPYEIEMARINFEGKTTTDGNSDNKNYVLNVDRDTQTSFVATVGFSEETNIIFMPGGIDIVAGQTISITGSVSNDGTYNVLGVGVFPFGGLLVFVDGTLTDETDVSVLITILTGAVYDLKRVEYDNEDDAEDFGLPSPTVFNIEELTPKRLLKKHGRWLRSLLYPFDLEKLVFQSTQRNANLKTVQGSVIIQENAEQPIHLMGDRMFLPFYFEFDTEVPASLISLLEENPNRCFSFNWEGETYTGFTIKVSQAVNTEADQRIKLLAGPGNDITKFIR